MPWVTVGLMAAGAASSYLSNQDSGEDASQSTNTTTSNQSTYSPNEAMLPTYGYMMGQANALVGEPVPYFAGQTYVGPSDYTQQGVQGLYDAAQAQYGTLQQANKNYNFLSNAADVANNPYVQGQLAANQRSVYDTLYNQAMPTLQSGAVGVNNLGSSRLGLAQGQAIGDTTKNLMNTNASYLANAYGQGLGAQQYALGQTGALNEAYTQPGNTLLKAGGVVEGYQERALEDAINRYNYQYEEPWTRISNMSGLLGDLYSTGTTYSGGTGTSYGTSDSGNSSDLSAILSGAISGYGLSQGSGSKIIKKT